MRGGKVSKKEGFRHFGAKRRKKVGVGHLRASTYIRATGHLQQVRATFGNLWECGLVSRRGSYDRSRKSQHAR